jgi:hypothetical protein
MLLASMDLWDIVDKFEEALPSNGDHKAKKEYQRRIKKVKSIISLNLANNQLTHIKSCKGLEEAWETLCNTHKTKSMFNILFVRCKLFMCKMQEGNNLLNHTNKINTLVDHLTCL